MRSFTALTERIFIRDEILEQSGSHPCVRVSVFRWRSWQARSSRNRAGYGRREAVGKYLELRLEYELGLYGEALMLNQLKQQLEAIRSQYGESLAVNLYQADLLILEGDTEGAKELLESCREEAEAVRKYRPEYEQLHRYLMCQLREEDQNAETETEDGKSGRAPFGI